MLNLIMMPNLIIPRLRLPAGALGIILKQFDGDISTGLWQQDKTHMRCQNICSHNMYKSNMYMNTKLKFSNLPVLGSGALRLSLKTENIYSQLFTYISLTAATWHLPRSPGFIVRPFAAPHPGPLHGLIRPALPARPSAHES